jgi:aryl-alcohol dehydrogenase-like predicted oxidoreductase
MMEYRPLGRAGMRVGSVSLGTQHFGSAGVIDRPVAQRLMGVALDGGVNLIDTADVYGDSDEIVGEYLERSGRRDDVLLATKFGVRLDKHDPNSKGGGRRWLTQSVERSLRRLRTDRIDLLQFHRDDRHTDIEETLHALTDLVTAGKVLTVGVSTFPPEAIVEARWASERNRFVRFRS